VVEEEPRARGVPSVPTSIAAAIGIAERGPLDEAVLCSSFEEYQTRFGGFVQGADLPLAAMGFFENGGSQLWCVRTAHHTEIAVPASVTAKRGSGYLLSPGAPTPARVTGTVPGPFLLENGAKLVLAIDEAPDQEVVFQGVAAIANAGGPGPFVLADGMTLGIKIDEGPVQTVTLKALAFAVINAATSDELGAVFNAALVGGKALVDSNLLRLASDTEGTASRIQVVGGTAAPVLGFPAAAVQGGGNVANLRAVPVEAVKTLAEASFVGIAASQAPGGVLDLRTITAGPNAQLQARPGTSPAFGLDALLHKGEASGAAPAVLVEGKDPGAYANTVEVEVRASAAGEPGAFDVAVLEDGVYRELFPAVRMAADSSRYIERVLNDPRAGSQLVRATDQKLPGGPTLPPQTVALSGGDDGLVGLTDADFVGSPTGRTGLHALDRIQDIALLLVPGRATPAVHAAMLRYAEVDRDGTLFAILDPPAGASATDIVTYVESTAALLNLTEFGAIYWPRVKVLNPARSALGPSDTLTVPPSGILAGVFARTDAARPGGVYDPPAGIDAGRLFGVLGFETDEVLEERKRDLVYPKRINPLTTGPGLPRFIDGSRTLKGDGNFPYVAERRGVIFIERSLKQGLQFARHKNNTEGLRATVRRTITSFLLTQMNNGAFRSRDPAKAFFVDVSNQLNTPTVIFAGKLLARVGLATNKPAEFIVLRISQDTRALEAELAGGS
jgi:uncharacterized protein